MKYQDVVAERVEEFREQYFVGSGAIAYVGYNGESIDDWLTTTLTQLVKEEKERIGEELLRLENELDHHNNHICRFNDSPQKCECYHGGVDTLKKHITIVTGVE